MKLVTLLLLLATGPLSAGEPPRAPAGALRLLIERFHLFPERPTASRGLVGDIGARERLLHMVGDPDALVTLGDLGGTETMRVKASFELNDVILHAIAPDQKLSAGDTHQRAAGDYSALDAIGRPYQFRLGARLVW